MNAAARTLTLVGSLGLALAAAGPAMAQPGSWSESGYVTIFVYPQGSGRTGREAAAVLETDVVDEINVGDAGTPATRQTGSLTIAGVGSAETSRALGDVEVDSGTLTINGSFVDGEIRLGVTTFSQFHEPSPGDLVITLSEMDGEIFVGNGTLGASFCTLADVSVGDLGHAIIDNCTVGHISGNGAASGGGSDIEITHAHVTSGLPNYRGDVFISNSVLESVMGTVTDGVIQIGSFGEPVSWDASATITVGGGDPTDLLLTEASIDSATSIVRGGGATEALLQGASTWRASTLFQVLSASTNLAVRGGSRILAGDQLWIGSASQVEVGSSVQADSSIEVGGDLHLGRASTTNFTSGGTLTIEDGGRVEVDGTLRIYAPAVLNLEPGGVLRVTALENAGTLNENGGTLIIPEPGDALPALAAIGALARIARRRLG